jgi:hypothetical protein
MIGLMVRLMVIILSQPVVLAIVSLKIPDVLIIFPLGAI